MMYKDTLKSNDVHRYSYIKWCTQTLLNQMMYTDTLKSNDVHIHS